ncbi:hypothetical protein MRX96_040585 [Rhipicephalus microplus]
MQQAAEEEPRKEMSGRLSPTAVQHLDVATASQNVQGYEAAFNRLTLAFAGSLGTTVHRRSNSMINASALASGSPSENRRVKYSEKCVSTSAIFSDTEPSGMWTDITYLQRQSSVRRVRKKRGFTELTCESQSHVTPSFPRPVLPLRFKVISFLGGITHVN